MTNENKKNIQFYCHGNLGKLINFFVELLHLSQQQQQQQQPSVLDTEIIFFKFIQ